MEIQHRATLQMFLTKLNFLLQSRWAVLYRHAPPNLFFPILAVSQLTTARKPEPRPLNLNHESWLKPLLDTERPIEIDEQTCREHSLSCLGSGLIAPVYLKERDPESGKVIAKSLPGILIVSGSKRDGGFTKEDGRVLGLLTDQLAALMVIAQMADYERAIEVSPVGLLSIDLASSLVILANPIALEAVGRDEVVGMRWETAISNPVFVALIEEARKSGQSVKEITSPATGRVFRAEAIMPTSAIEGQPTQVIVALIDATPVHQMEKMIGQLSHELRTPLTTIRGFTETLRENAADLDEALRFEFYGLILRAAERMQGMAEQLLSIARLRAGAVLQFEITEFDLVSLVKEALSDCTERVTERHHHSLDAPSRLLITADQTKLHQVAINLITNATKYSPEGGEIRIEVADLGNEAEISVRDSGIGIAPEDIEKIGEWCFRTEGSREIAGIGIGMYFVKNVVKTHNGRLTIESEGLGRGSTFSVILPKTHLRK